MKLSFGFAASASALTADRLRMDVISSNIAHANTTRGKLVNGKWEPYVRKMTVLEPKTNSFSSVLSGQMGQSQELSQGVKVTRIVEDSAPFKIVYNPTHPDADAEGNVLMPNVDILKEMVDMIAATRSYDANVTAFNASKAMISKALEIGR